MARSEKKPGVAARVAKAVLAPVFGDFWLKAAALAIAIAIYALLDPGKKKDGAADAPPAPRAPEVFPLNSAAAQRDALQTPPPENPPEKTSLKK